MTGRQAISAYAQAKSRADIDAALTYCTPDVVIETFPFQTVSRGEAQTRLQLGLFFEVFPDYNVESEGMIEQGDVVVGWGHISATMRADIGSVAATGSRFRVPFTCVWDTRDGLMARERFYFDLNSVCEQLGVSTEAVARELHAVKPLLEGDPVTSG